MSSPFPQSSASPPFLLLFKVPPKLVTVFSKMSSLSTLLTETVF